MSIVIPRHVLDCLKRLESGGYRAWIVGGCVRDALLNRQPSDWDVCTGAKPADVQHVFRNCRIVATGIEHGTVTLITDNGHIEITTMRRDGRYSDRRRPDNVSFTEDLREDLSRRDFTVNAMAYHPEHGLQDPFGGGGDLALKILRCVGEPRTRFSEDALRILRLFRFLSQLAFTPEEDTLDAARECSPLLEAISRERISAELNRLLLGMNAEHALLLMADTGVLSAVIPEFEPAIGFDQHNPHHNRTVDRHTFAAVSDSPQILRVRLALLLHDIGKPAMFYTDDAGIGHFKYHARKSAEMSDEILRRLRYPRKLSEDTVTLIRLHSRGIPVQPGPLRKLLSQYGSGLIRDLFAVKSADERAKTPDTGGRLEELCRAGKLMDELLAENPCLSRSQLAVNGSDLIELGIAPGKELGLILDRLLEMVLENPALNTRDGLLRAVSEL